MTLDDKLNVARDLMLLHTDNKISSEAVAKTLESMFSDKLEVALDLIGDKYLDEELEERFDAADLNYHSGVTIILDQDVEPGPIEEDEYVTCDYADDECIARIKVFANITALDKTLTFPKVLILHWS